MAQLFLNLCRRTEAILLASADSMAWSYAARRTNPLPGCPGTATALTAWPYATTWRNRILTRTAAGWPTLRHRGGRKTIWRTEDPCPCCGPGLHITDTPAAVTFACPGPNYRAPLGFHPGTDPPGRT